MLDSTTPDVPPLIDTASANTSYKIPNYLLTDILVNLDTFDLIVCRSVCHLWKWHTDHRAILKQLLFTAPPTPHTVPATLHPVFRRLDYHLHPQLHRRRPLQPLTSRVDLRLNLHDLHSSPVVENFASAPATTRVLVTMCGGKYLVERGAGVRVWDLLVGLDMLMIDRHRKDDDPSFLGERVEWDYMQFPFAGFRIVASGTDTLEVKPEFYNVAEMTREAARRMGMQKVGVPLVTFDIGEGEVRG